MRILLVILPFISVFAYSNRSTNQVLKLLNNEIEKRNSYFEPRNQNITFLKGKLEQVEGINEKYSIYRELHHNCVSYNYDLAYKYANDAYRLSLQINDEVEILKSKYDLIYCYISAGLFIEAYNLLTSIDEDKIPDNRKYRYYTLYSRLYSDMADYSTGILLHQKYIKESICYINLALPWVEADTKAYDYLDAYKTFILKEETSENKLALYHDLIVKHEENVEENAQISSTLGQLYYEIGEIDKAIYYMAWAAISDIRNGIKETTALTVLASYLYESNQIEEASRYLYIALEDANFYNAFHRRLKINSLLPLIEKERMTLIRQQKSKLSYFSLSVSLLILFISFSLFTIYRQNRKLIQAKQNINNQLEEVSSMYEQLEESNRIKDQEIFKSLYNKSGYLDKVELILKRLDRKLKTKQYSDVNSLYKEFNLKSERETIYDAFDRAFLKLYPTFIEQYNALLQSDKQATLDEKGNLTPELRIFALIRLGINDNENIAQFLNLSLNTIYAYKTRVKNKTIVPKEEFETHIMNIQKK